MGVVSDTLPAFSTLFSPTWLPCSALIWGNVLSLVPTCYGMFVDIPGRPAPFWRKMEEKWILGRRKVWVKDLDERMEEKLCLGYNIWKKIKQKHEQKKKSKWLNIQWQLFRCYVVHVFNLNSWQAEFECRLVYRTISSKARAIERISMSIKKVIF